MFGEQVPITEFIPFFFIQTSIPAICLKLSMTVFVALPLLHLWHVWSVLFYTTSHHPCVLSGHVHSDFSFDYHFSAIFLDSLPQIGMSALSPACQGISCCPRSWHLPHRVVASLPLSSPSIRPVAPVEQRLTCSSFYPTNPAVFGIHSVLNIYLLNEWMKKSGFY